MVHNVIAQWRQQEITQYWTVCTCIGTGPKAAVVNASFFDLIRVLLYLILDASFAILANDGDYIANKSSGIQGMKIELLYYFSSFQINLPLP